jgi:hypothetical protein
MKVHAKLSSRRGPVGMYVPNKRIAYVQIEVYETLPRVSQTEAKGSTPGNLLV